MRLVCIVLILSFLFSCSKESRPDKSESPMEKENSSAFVITKERISLLDSLFRLRQNVKVFLKRAQSDSLEQMQNNTWPDSVEITYNFVMNDSTDLALMKEIPTVESGDFSLIYNYYFLAGNTFAIKSQISFFNEDCSSSALEETRIYYFDDKGESSLREYVLKDKLNVSLDSTDCGFGDLPNFHLYKKFSETPLYSTLHSVNR